MFSSQEPIKYGFSMVDGVAYEKTLFETIKQYSGYFEKPIIIYNKEQIKANFGLCMSDNKYIIGVDILCKYDNKIYAIQCKQSKNRTEKREVIDFVNYVKHLEKNIKEPIIKLWSSSINPCQTGIDYGNMNGVTWIIDDITHLLQHNTANYIFFGNFLYDSNGDTIMN